MADVSIRPPLNPIQPGAYSSVDASALRGQGDLGLKILAILGDTKGGAPNTPMYFRDQTALKSILRSGAAYDCARFAIGAGGLPVCVMRVGAAILQSTSALAGATGTPVTLTSLDYGVWNNSIKRTVEANNKVTIAFTDPFGVRFTEVYDMGAGATPQNIVDAINGLTPGYPKSTLVSAAVTSGSGALTVAAETAMTGGSDGTISAGDWTTALTALEPEDVSIVHVATGDASVHALVVTHCDNMSSTIARKERTTVAGAVAGEAPSAQVTRMASLRNKRAQLVYPGMQDFDDSGLLVSYAPFYTAAKVAAQHAALPDVATALTHKRVELVDVERKLSTLQGSDVDVLLRAGVTPVAPAPGGGFWVVDSLSGYNTDEVFKDFHKVRTADEVCRRVRVRLEEVFVGGKILDATVGNIQTETQTELQKLRDEEIVRAFKTPTVEASTQDARVTLVGLPVVLPETQKFIYITLALQPSSAISREAPVADDALL